MYTIGGSTLVCGQQNAETTKGRPSPNKPERNSKAELGIEPRIS
jgi:hypothetical protein